MIILAQVIKLNDIELMALVTPNIGFYEYEYVSRPLPTQHNVNYDKTSWKTNCTYAKGPQI